MRSSSRTLAPVGYESPPNLILLTPPLKDSGEPQQIRQGERALIGARQGRLPVLRAQDRALAAPHQSDQDLRDDSAADQPQAPAVSEDRRFGQDVVPERRAIEEPGILEHLGLLLARRASPDPARSEDGYVAHPGEPPLERAGDRLARGQAQQVAAQEVAHREASAVSLAGSSPEVRQLEERFDRLRVDAAGPVERRPRR